MSKDSRWTVKGDKLPDENTNVLITKKNSHGENYVMSAQYWDDHTFRVLMSDGNIYDVTNEVIAWKSFPKPFIEKD